MDVRHRRNLERHHAALRTGVRLPSGGEVRRLRNGGTASLVQVQHGLGRCRTGMARRRGRLVRADREHLAEQPADQTAELHRSARAGPVQRGPRSRPLRRRDGRCGNRIDVFSALNRTLPSSFDRIHSPNAAGTWYQGIDGVLSSGLFRSSPAATVFDRGQHDRSLWPAAWTKRFWRSRSLDGGTTFGGWAPLSHSNGGIASKWRPRPPSPVRPTHRCCTCWRAATTNVSTIRVWLRVPLCGAFGWKSAAACSLRPRPWRAPATDRKSSPSVAGYRQWNLVELLAQRGHELGGLGGYW